MKTPNLFSALFGIMMIFEVSGLGADVTALSGSGSNASPDGVYTNVIQAPSYPMLTRTSHCLSRTNALGVAINFGEPTKQEIEIVEGGAKAEFGLHKVYFPADVGGGQAVTIITPDGRQLVCRATFLALSDAASGQAVLVGQVTNSIGNVVGSNTVIYPEAFTSISADIRYRYTKFALEQDIILHQSPRLPSGFNTNSTRLEVWSEWFESEPESLVSQQLDLRPNAVGTDRSLTEDENASFGTMRIGAGHAFSAEAPEDRIPVGKSWGKTGGRTWLVEKVDYPSLKPKLDLLPPAQASVSDSPVQRSREELIRSLAANRTPSQNGEKMLLAKADTARGAAVVMDFTIVSCVPVPSGIISWWPAGGVASDAITNNHGSLNNDATYAPGMVGQGFYFDGSGDSVQIANATSLNPSNGLTIEAWIYYPSDKSGVNMPIVSKDTSGGRQYLLTKFSDNKLRAHVGTTNGAFYYTGGQTALQPDAWYHVAMTYSAASSNLAIYVNGALDTNVLVSGSIKSANTPLYLGGAPPWSYWWKGGIDEAAVYDRALSQSELLAIYEAGTAGKRNPNCITPPTNISAWWAGDANYFDLARTNFVSLQNGLAWTPAEVSSGFQFDGDDDTGSVADNAAFNFTTNEDFSVEMWVQPTYSETDDGEMTLLSKREIVNGTTYQGWELYLVDGQPALRMADAPARSGNGATFIAEGYDLRDDGWHHLAVTVNRTNSSGGHFYVDGVSVLTFNPNTQTGSLSNTVALLLGVHPDTNLHCNYAGVMDEVSLYRRELTSTEIVSLYSAGCAGKCKLDSDGDGLTDLEEAFSGTNPNEADTDADGTRDGDEVFLYHTNPNSQDSDGDSVIDQLFKVTITRPTDNSTIP